MNAGAEHKIVIVDDIAENLQALGSMLDSRGYDVAFAMSGKEALDIINSFAPDLVLLDVAMPGMDGFEVCRRLKSNPRTSDVPVIFLTAYAEQEYIVQGFAAGAADYVSKPLRQGELMARVNAHIALRKARCELAKRNIELGDLLRERNEVISIATHDIKSPLQGIILAVEVIKSMLRRGQNEKIDNQLESILKTSDRINDILGNWLSLSAVETGAAQFSSELINAAELAGIIKDFYSEKAAAKGIDIRLKAPDYIAVYSDRNALMTILDNLTSNAVKFSSSGGEVVVSVREEQENVVFEIADRGPGILSSEMPLLFKKFTRLSARPTANENSTGLGLAIVKQIVERLQGVVYCTSEIGHGATFCVELPARPK